MFDNFLKAVVFTWIIVEAQGRDEAIAALSGKVSLVSTCNMFS